MLSIKRAETAWKAAKPYWNALSIGRVDKEAAEKYGKFRRTCKPITVRNELAVIRAALNWAKKETLIADAPFVQMPKFTTRKIRHLTKTQFRKLVAAAHAPHVALFMKLAVGTGARSTALLELTWDRVNFTAGTIELNPEDRVQTSKHRATVPMNDQLREALEEAKPGAMSDYVIEYGSRRVLSVKKGFEAAAARAGLKVTPHMLRHSAAVWMAEADVPMAQIAQFLGHTDSRITERVYARFSPNFLASAAESLTW
jgi:integrase